MKTREGGFIWNAARGFAMTWTVIMLMATVLGLRSYGQQIREPQSQEERAGGAIGAAMGLGMLGAFWFFPTVGTLVIGLAFKKSSEIEKG